MQYKALNCYRIIHKDGTIEEINAEDISTAISNLAVTEEESVIVNISLLKEDIRTVIEEEPAPENPEDEDTPENPEDITVGGDVDIGGNA